MSERPNLILDIDETLINSVNAKHLMKKISADKKIKDKARKFTWHNMDGIFLVFERPQLQEFLDYVFDNFNVSIWTAASKDYAIFILQHCILTKPQRKINYFFFDYHCSISEKLDLGLKNISLIWTYFREKNYSERNTLILDDNERVEKINKENIIKITKFDFKSKESFNDQELSKIKGELVNRLSRFSQTLDLRK